MPVVLKAIWAILVLVGFVHTHFTLQTPPSIGFTKKSENLEPCGGIHVDLLSDKTTDFFADGGNIGTDSTYHQSSWLFRITTDNTAIKNWAPIYPVFNTTGTGKFCALSVKVPSKYIGKKAIIGVVGSTPNDGYLYQCSAVNIIEGIGPPSKACSNDTGVSSVYSFDTDIAGNTAQGGGVSVYGQPDSNCRFLALVVGTMVCSLVLFMI